MRPYLALIAISTALSTPNLASAQGYKATLDALGSMSGTDKFKGNWIVPSGGYELSAYGGAQVNLISIKAELQYLSGSVWTSFNPKLEQTAGTSPTNWSTSGWNSIQGGFSYRVRVVMEYEYRLDPANPWTPDTITNSDYQKAFP